MAALQSNPTPRTRRQVLARIIFETDTPAGKLYDIVLIVIIVLSVVVAMLDSVGTIHDAHETLLEAAEWCLTIFFTLNDRG
jgi:voltage-gated potassium channel